jgi:hypothetical protein
MKFILILTILKGGYDGGSAIDHIDNFNSLESCQKAGEKWKSHFNNFYQDAFFECVEL